MAGFPISTPTRMVRTGGELNVSISSPVRTSTARRSYGSEAKVRPAADAVEGVMLTYASLGRLPGAKVSWASPAVTVPPTAARISVEPAGGGPRAVPGSLEIEAGCSTAGRGRAAAAGGGAGRGPGVRGA